MSRSRARLLMQELAAYGKREAADLLERALDGEPDAQEPAEALLRRLDEAQEPDG